MAAKPGSKYHPLFRHLQQAAADRIVLRLDQIEALLDEPLPASARRGTAFWANRRRGGHQATAWMEAGYHVTAVDLAHGRIVFERPLIHYQVKPQGDSWQWDGEAVRALRAHMDVNQGELAAILGVRQQTVSEWENDIYRPTRSRSKHLAIIAERAEFPFKGEADTT
jgi:DNA-binding XRE family transcriptional regulator